MDATGRAGYAHPAPGCAAWCPAATALLGLPGLMVTAVAQADDGCAVVDVLTAPERAGAARCCPDCGVRAAVKETVTTMPRDVYLGDRQILLRWRKRRWECENPDCERKTFTESLPAVPPGPPADSPTPAIRPAASAWPPPEPPGRLVSAVPGGGHGK